MAVVFGETVDVDGVALQTKYAKGGAFQRKQGLLLVVNIKLFVAPAVEQPQITPSAGDVLQLVAHAEPVVGAECQAVLVGLLPGLRPVLRQQIAPFLIQET